MTAFTAGALCTLCDCKRQAHLNVFGAVHKLCLRYKCQASATKRVTFKLSCFFFFSLQLFSNSSFYQLNKHQLFLCSLSHGVLLAKNTAAVFLNE